MFKNFILYILFLSASISYAKKSDLIIRVGYFPNLTHAQAILGQEQKTFENKLKDFGHIKWIMFNAGPAAIEALFAKELDFLYVGPSPAINAYVRSQGQAIAVISGSASGGVRFVLHKDTKILNPKDFKHKTILSPQLGNTQDISLKNWLMSHGLNPKIRGDVKVVSISSSDQLAIFSKKQANASWISEPWASILIHQAGAIPYLDERDIWKDKVFASTVLAVHPEFLKKHQKIVEKWVVAHVDITQWILKNPDLSKKTLYQSIVRITGKKFSEKIFYDAYKFVDFTYDPVVYSFLTFSQQAFKLGFYGNKSPNITNLFQLDFLKKTLVDKKLPPIKE